MHVAVELSLYPLADEFIPPIQDFIERLHSYKELNVATNSMSTYVSGELNAVFEALQREIGTSLENLQRAVFVMKVLGGRD